jgi:carbon-monoxide dehydrogenase small subunit
MDRVRVEFRVNGRDHGTWVWPNQTLLYALRDELGATDVKYGCGEGVCGACTVLIDGESVNACLIFAVQVAGSSITTARGLAEDGSDLGSMQESFLRHGAAQCGFCTPGMLMVAHEFAAEHPSATRDEIREAIAGNLCRCTGYTKIVDAIEAASRGSRAATASRAESGVTEG